MKKHGTKTVEVNSLSRSQSKKNKNLANKAIRKDGKRKTNHRAWGVNMWTDYL